MSIIETDPSLALQAAQRAALIADAGLIALGISSRVYDRPPPGAVFPYVKIGEDVVFPQDSDCGSDTILESMVRVFSRSPAGRVECKRFAERIRFLLTLDAGFAVTGYRVTVGHCESYRIEEHTDGLTTSAIIEFRYRLIPVAP